MLGRQISSQISDPNTPPSTNKRRAGVVRRTSEALAINEQFVPTDNGRVIIDEETGHSDSLELTGGGSPSGIDAVPRGRSTALAGPGGLDHVRREVESAVMNSHSRSGLVLPESARVVEQISCTQHSQPHAMSAVSHGHWENRATALIPATLARRP